MQAAVRERVAGLSRRLRRRVVLLGVARAAAVLVGMLVLGLVLDRWLELGRLGRFVFWGVTLAAAGHWLYHHAVRPSLVRLSPVEVAAAWDRSTGGGSGRAAGIPLAPRVATVLEMPRQLGGSHAPSAGMVARAVRAGHDAVAHADLAAGLNPRPVRLAAGLLAAAVVVPLLIAMIWPSTAGLWARRWLAFSDQPWPRSTSLALPDLRDGVLTVPRGEPFEVRVRVADKGEPTETVRLTLRPTDGADGDTRRATMEAYGGGATTGGATAGTPGGATPGNANSGGGVPGGGGGDFRHTLAPLQGDASLTLAGGDATLGPVTVRPVDRPRLTGLTLTSTHPRHPGDPPAVHTFTGEQGDAALLPNTAATLRLAANVPVASLRASAGSFPAEPRRVDGRTFDIAWTHTATARFDVVLAAAGSDLVSYPLPVTVRLQADQPPTVTLTPSGVRQRITPNARVPLEVVARDDHGLRQVELAAALAPATALPGDETTQAGPSPIPAIALFNAAAAAAAADDVPTTFDTALDFDLSDREAKPGDVLTLVATAADNGYAGVQTTPSRTLSFRLVTRDELFREVLLRQQGLRTQFRQAATEAQSIADALTLTETPADAAGLRGRFAAVQRQVRSVSQGLHDTAAEMRLNRLAGDEAFDLMKEHVLDPLATLHDTALAAQRRTLETLGNPSPPPDTLDTARQQQTTIVATMENILRQMDQFDSFIDVVNQLNEVLNLQRSVLDSTRALSNEKRDALFDD